MNTNYSPVVAGLLLYFCMVQTASSQIQFLDCSSVPVKLCLEDPNVSLPANNQLFVGENNPESSSCSVHLQHTTRVKSACGSMVIYDVLIQLDGDSTDTYLTTLSAEVDSNQEATLFFSTENVANNEITANGLPYASGCGNYHLLKWVARDTCGNEKTCVYPLELYDCKMPEVDWISGTSTIVIPGGGQITLFVKDFFGDIRDECQDSSDIVYSFETDSFAPFKTYHACDFYPSWGVPIDHNFWVADGGQDLNCNDTIEWEERNLEKHILQLIVIVNNGGIDCWQDSTIGGTIRLPNVNPLGSVEVTLTGDLITTHFKETSTRYLPWKYSSSKKSLTGMDCTLYLGGNSFRISFGSPPFKMSHLLIV